MLALFGWQTVGAGNPNFSALQQLGLGNRIHAAELEHPAAAVLPDSFHFYPARPYGRFFTEQKNLAQPLKSFRLAGEGNRGQLAAVSPSPPQPGDSHPLAVFRETHSRISSVKRRFSFIPAAPRMVRMDRAVRPCFPMTLPRSLGATRSSKTVTCSPSTTCTATSSGMSTRAFAMSSINCFIPAPP